MKVLTLYATLYDDSDVTAEQVASELHALLMYEAERHPEPSALDYVLTINGEDPR